MSPAPAPGSRDGTRGTPYPVEPDGREVRSRDGGTGQDYGVWPQGADDKLGQPIRCYENSHKSQENTNIDSKIDAYSSV